MRKGRKDEMKANGRGGVGAKKNTEDEGGGGVERIFWKLHRIPHEFQKTYFKLFSPLYVCHTVYLLN